jgi:hypothetical protein
MASSAGEIDLLKTPPPVYETQTKDFWPETARSKDKSTPIRMFLVRHGAADRTSVRTAPAPNANHPERNATYLDNGPRDDIHAVFSYLTQDHYSLANSMSP